MHPDFPQLPIPTGNKATLNSARISTAEDVLKIEQAKTTLAHLFVRQPCGSGGEVQFSLSKCQ
jgi:hypothetical protein